VAEAESQDSFFVKKGGKNMKNLIWISVVALTFCTTAMASDIAISTQANWWSQAAADRETQEIVDNVKDVSVELFSANEQDALAEWVIAHTGDGAPDLLMLCGQCPDTIYAPGNTQPDGSLIELFLDDGNCIINTGDWIFYVVNGAGTNGTAALPNIMDISSMDMWDDDTPVTVTAEGKQYTPSLTDFSTDRAIHLDLLENDWHTELILAIADDENRADPVILRNSVTDGRIGVFFQTASQDNDPRGEVISEWINNWFLKFVAIDNPYARGPDPKDGALHESTWVTLRWREGDLAVSHNVYLGDNFDEVNNATTESDTFRGNQTTSYYVAGFPGFAYPDGLVPGTTYYWRIDEVNEANPDSPWKGPVWSFWLPPRKAYNPVPADGSKFIIADDVELTWAPGYDAKLHTVYFGKNFNEVNDGVVGMPQATTTYTPGALDLETTYYWRVDEFDGMTTHKGDVWSFTTVPVTPITDENLVGWWKLDEGMGTTVMDWSGYGNHGTLMGNLKWVDGYQGGALEFGVGRYVDCGTDAAKEVTADFTLAAWAKLAPSTAGNYGGIAGRLMYDGTNYRGFAVVRHSSNVYRLWVGDGSSDLAKSAASSNVTYTDTEWHHVAGVREGQINALYVDGVRQASTTVTGFVPSSQFFYIGRQYSTQTDRTFVGLIDDVRIYNKALTVDELTEAMKGNPLLAWSAIPASGSNPDIDTALPLSWSSGENVSQHDVYFGTDKDAVEVADSTDATGIYRGRQNSTTYTPSEGVEWGGGPYFWRIDEVHTDGTISTGYVWSFTVADFILVDDFESYTDNDAAGEAIWQHWIDGYGVADNGALAGNPNPPYTEQRIIHSGGQSMPLLYENTAPVTNSEAVLTLTAPRDWTRHDLANLSLWIQGASDNAADPMYLSVANSTGSPVVVANENAVIATVEDWTEWVIPLQVLADQGINLSNVDKIAIGLGTKAGMAAPGGTGTIYLDDIRLYRP